MTARGPLGHHAPELRVVGVLGQGEVGQHFAPPPQDGHGGVVEGGVDGQPQRAARGQVAGAVAGAFRGCAHGLPFQVRKASDLRYSGNTGGQGPSRRARKRGAPTASSRFPSGRG